MGKTWKPTVARILNIIARVFSLLGVISAIFAVGSGLYLWAFCHCYVVYMHFREENGGWGLLVQLLPSLAQYP